MKNKVCILSMDNLDGFFSYDDLLKEPFKQHGIDVETVSWRNSQSDWNEYDAVIVRSTWDYQDDCEQFLNVLEKIESSSATLMNSLRVIKWNISKTYLKELEDKQVPTVPTLWGKSFNTNTLKSAQVKWPNQQLIIKPTVSANADDTFRLSKDSSTDALIESLTEHFPAGREFMLQPFLNSIVEHGEYSLFYFGGVFSHAIKKCPANGDFRVQEEHGGEFFQVNPDSAIKEVAERALGCVDETLLYARIDVALLNDNTPAIIEMELIEPSLYFGVDEASAERFVKAYLSMIDR